jgi:hypothetical protein
LKQQLVNYMYANNDYNNDDDINKVYQNLFYQFRLYKL